MKNLKQFLSIVLLFSALFVCCSKKSQQVKQQPVEISWLFPIKQDTAWGYIDDKGQLVIASQYDEASPFSEGLAAVRVGKNWGYIDRTGNIKIDFQFKFAGEFSEGAAFVFLGEDYKKISKDSTDGVIALTAKSPGGRLENQSVDDKYSNVSKGGYIDTSGNIIIDPRFYEGNKFSEGIAFVGLKNRIEGYITYLTIGGLEKEHTVIQTRKIGYIDKSGNLITPKEFNDGGDFHLGMAPVRIGKKWGFINKTGMEVIEPRLDGTLGFNEGLAAVKEGKKWGFLDTSGTMIIKAQYDGVLNFEAGMAPVKIGQKWGYIDKTGTLVVNTQFDDASVFSEELASIKIDNKWGYIDKTGKVVITPQFENAARFFEGLAKIKTGDQDGYIDQSGTLLWPVAKK
jgi:hypothetical protein